MFPPSLTGLAYISRHCFEGIEFHIPAIGSFHFLDDTHLGATISIYMPSPIIRFLLLLYAAFHAPSAAEFSHTPSHNTIRRFSERLEYRQSISMPHFAISRLFRIRLLLYLRAEYISNDDFHAVGWAADDDDDGRRAHGRPLPPRAAAKLDKT